MVFGVDRRGGALYAHGSQRATANGRSSPRWFMRIKAGGNQCGVAAHDAYPVTLSGESSSFGLTLKARIRIVDALQCHRSLCAQTPPPSRQRLPSTIGRAGPDTSQRSASRTRSRDVDLREACSTTHHRGPAISLLTTAAIWHLPSFMRINR